MSLIKSLSILLIFFFQCLISQSQIVKGETSNSLDISLSNNINPVYFENTNRKFIDLRGRWDYTEDDKEWISLKIPSSYEGTRRLKFKRYFDIQTQYSESAVFHFISFGINYYCEISINGRFIGKHVGNSPFVLRISDNILRPQNNEIQIVVQNSLNPYETVPLQEQIYDPQNFGGIFREIGIMISGPVWCSNSEILSVLTGDGNTSIINFSVNLNSADLSRVGVDSIKSGQKFSKKTFEYFCELYDKTSGALISRSSVHTYKLESYRITQVKDVITASNLELWSPYIPRLYNLRQIVMQGGKIVDEMTQTIGFRRIEIKNGSYYLNGEKIVIRGVCYYEYSQPHNSSIDENEIERDIILIKNLGANAIRVMSTSLNPYLLSLCDKYGLLIFFDLPLWKAPSSLLAKTKIQWVFISQLQEILSWNGYHPSCVAWGIGNGIDASKNIYESFLEKVISSVNKSDNYLFYTSVSCYRNLKVPSSIDFIMLDITSHSAQTIAKFIGAAADLSQTLKKPVIIGSIGLEIQVNNYNGITDPRSADSQAQFFLDIYPSISKMGYSGIFIHSFNDWKTARPLLNQDPEYQYYSTSGLVDQYRRKRIAYDVVRALINDEKPPTLTIGTYTEVFPPVFVITGILIILLFAVSYNLFGRFRENVIRSLLRPFNFFSDVRDQRMLSVVQTSIIGFVGCLSGALYISNILYSWRMSRWFDYFLSQFIRSNGLKEILDACAWYPYLGIILITFVFFIVLFLFSILLRIFSLLLKRKIFLFDTYCVSMWSVLPMLFLAPFGMILNRIMPLAGIAPIACIILVVFIVWIFTRLLKGSAIVMEIRLIVFYLIGYCSLLCGCILWLYYLNNTYAVFDYLEYGWNVSTFMRSFN